MEFEVFVFRDLLPPRTSRSVTLLIPSILWLTILMMKAVLTTTARATASMRATQPVLSAGRNVLLQPRPAAVGLPPRAIQRQFGRSQLQLQSAALARSFHTTRPAAAPKSPFQAFVDTLKEEYAKSQEFQESMKQLDGEAGKVKDSETMRKMKEAYERARIITSIKENPRLQKAAEQLRKNGGHVGDAVGAALKQMEDSELIKGVSIWSEHSRGLPRFSSSASDRSPLCPPLSSSGPSPRDYHASLPNRLLPSETQRPIRHCRKP